MNQDDVCFVFFSEQSKGVKNLTGTVVFCFVVISLQQHLRKLMGGYRNERSKKCPEITFKVYAWSTKQNKEKAFFCFVSMIRKKVKKKV